MIPFCELVVRASTSQSVDLGFIPFVESYLKTKKMIRFTASLLGARHLGEVMKNKPASSLVVSLGNALNGTPPIYMWKTGGPETSEMTTPKRVRMSCPRFSDTICFLLRGG